jgi:hypothetical protein
MAGDAEDAVELLSYSAKCARKPVVFSEFPNEKAVSTVMVFKLYIERSVGDAHQMIIEHEVDFDDRTVVKWTSSAKFSDLLRAVITENDKSGVRLYCSRQHFFCFTNQATESNGQTVVVDPTDHAFINVTAGRRTYRLLGGDYEGHLALCDEVTATRAKLAIDTLIELNKPNSTASPPAAGAPTTLTSKKSDLFETLDLGNPGVKK